MGGHTLQIDAARRSVTFDGARVELTELQFDILAHLAAKDGQVVAKEELVEQVWDRDVEVLGTRLVDTQIARLRGKLSHAAIVTERGIGWKLGDVTASLHDERIDPALATLVKAKVDLERAALATALAMRHAADVIEAAVAR